MFYDEACAIPWKKTERLLHPLLTSRTRQDCSKGRILSSFKGVNALISHLSPNLNTILYDRACHAIEGNWAWVPPTSMMKLALLLFATVALANPVADPLPDEPAPVSVPGDLVARQASCTVRGLGDRRDGSGTCLANTFSSCPYVSIANFCPNTPSNIQCCRVIRCAAPYSNWTCRNTYKGCGSGGRWVSGYCPGGSDIRCCVPA